MAPQTAAAQQSDNIAHAISGAGGGILSMALTYRPPLLDIPTQMLTPADILSSLSLLVHKSNPNAPILAFSMLSSALSSAKA
jgi:hypothetical protein